MEKFTDTWGAKQVRWASAEEIAAAQAEGGHIFTACKCGHPGLWMHKGLALNADGSYNGARNIFYLGWRSGPECSCPPRMLHMVVEE